MVFDASSFHCCAELPSSTQLMDSYQLFPKDCLAMRGQISYEMMVITSIDCGIGARSY